MEQNNCFQIKVGLLVVSSREEPIRIARYLGITKKDVKLEIIDCVTLEISGQFPPETHCNLKWHVKERPTGAFRRTFLLPQNVLASKLRAFEVDGMLVVKIPKKKSC
ncbi:hypothetical protein KP509_36G012000 [Ceratopteris richardii]|uniref:SHSP domain-containing protein n=1 Tax=Ceratopteris richardii TaxID=49495 RepID=A0A8T2QAT4_CERRI|nr:hypothetical protein KP509_36G012000 [Ceratopteris richardii]